MYKEYYAELAKRLLSNNENADRAILTLSTAMLGWSMAFIRDIVPLPEAHLRLLLYISWGLFCLAIVATILSFFTSQRAIEKKFQVIRDQHLGTGLPDESKPSWEDRFTEWLNIFGACLFIFGLLATCVFVGVNT
jgi:hypothetical protein